MSVTINTVNMALNLHLCLSPMEPTTNPTPTPTSGDGVFTNEVTKLPNSPHSSEKDDGVDFSLKQGSESTEALDTENGSRSVDNNQSSGTEDLVGAKDLQTEPDSVDDDVEIVIKNQHKYYIYCPCCGEDITKTVKLVKILDHPPTKNRDTENGSISKDKETTVPSWFPGLFKTLFPSVYGHVEEKGEKEIDSKSPGTYNYIDINGKEPSIDINGKEPSIDINGKEPSIDINDKKDRPSFPKWYLEVFAWLFLCIIIALSVLSISPPPIIQPHLQMQLPSIPSLRLPSVSVLSLLPTFAVLLLFIISMRSRFSLRYHEEKGDKKVDSKSTDANSEKQSLETQFHDDQAADTDQDSEKKTENQKNHLTPIYPSSWKRPSKQIFNKETHENAENQKNHLTPICPSPRKRPSKQIVNKETHEIAEIGTPANTQAELVSQPNAQPEIPNSVKGGTKLEILKSVVYGGLTESITSLCTVTSAAASGASTLNVLALGVANLSSGLLLTVHSLQELINEKPKRQTNTDDQIKSESDEEDRYEESLGRRENSRIHKLITITSFVIFGLIPPLVYGFSFRRKIEKRQDYKVIAVYAVSLLCIVLLSIAKAYVSKRREYMKTLFRYTTMAATASGFSQFVGYMISQWLEKSGFYDDSPENTSI